MPTVGAETESTNEPSLVCNERPTNHDTTRILHVRCGNLPSSLGFFSSVEEPWRQPTSPVVGLICETWPVWLFGLQALPCSLSHVWVHSPFPPWLDSLQACYPRVSFICGADFLLQAKDLLFVHRSNDWVVSVVSSLTPSLPVVVSFTTGPLPTSSHYYQFELLSSRQCGVRYLALFMLAPRLLHSSALMLSSAVETHHRSHWTASRNSSV